jgi:hypothetical protein
MIEFIKYIGFKHLVHLNLWDIQNHDPPVKTHEQIPELTYDESYAQPSLEDVWAQ